MSDRTPAEAGYYLDEYDAPRFWQHVDFDGGNEYARDPLATASGECWNWNGQAELQGKRYGRHRVFGTWHQAHRIAWLDFGRKIPNGLHMDHLCRNTRCVNPDHLDPVTQAENVQRGILGAITACSRGHTFTPENTHFYQRNGHTVRVCKTCRSNRKRNRQQSAAA